MVLSDGSILVIGGYTTAVRNDVWKSVNGGASWTVVASTAGWTGNVTEQLEAVACRNMSAPPLIMTMPSIVDVVDFAACFCFASCLLTPLLHQLLTNVAPPSLSPFTFM